MPIELDNFRKKYPQYNDLGDAELAGMLAKKYPDAYGDLPGKVKAKEELKPATWQQKYGPYIRNALEYGGATAGGLLTAPVAIATGPGAPITEAAGIGAGYLAGKTTADYILGPPKNAAEATKGIISDIPESLMVGMSGPVGGKVIGGLARKASVFGMPTTDITPEMASRIVEAETSGVPYTIADISQKKSHAIIEAQLRRNAGSADIAHKFVQKQYAALQDFAKNIQSKVFGGASDELSAGQVAQKGAKVRYGSFQAKARKLYEDVPVDGATKIETKTLANVAGENYDELGKINNQTVKRILNITRKDTVATETGLLDATGKPITTKAPAYTWQELLADQSSLRKMARTTNDYNLKRIYKGLVNAINDDVAAFAEKTQDPNVKNALDDAVSFYRDGDAKFPGIRVWRDNQIANMVKTNSPEDIVKKFFKAYPNKSDISRLKSTVGSKGFQDLKRAWLDDLLTKGEGQSFSPAKFATAYDRYRAGGNLDVMLNSQEKKGLDMLYDISKRINAAERLAGNPSGTGQININDLFRWVRHPISKTVETIGANRFAELYFNNYNFRMKVFNLLERAPTARSVGGNIGPALAIGSQKENRPALDSFWGE